MSFTEIFYSLTEVHWLTPSKAQKRIVEIKATMFSFF